MRNSGNPWRISTCVLALALVGLAWSGCGEKKQETALVPEGMRQTTVTADTLAVAATEAVVEPGPGEMTEGARATGGQVALATEDPPSAPSGGAWETSPPEPEVPETTPAEPESARPVQSDPQPAARPTAEAKSPSNTRHPGLGPYTLQVGSFQDSASADRRAAALRAAGIRSRIVTVELNGAAWHRVLVPNLESAAEAGRLGERLQRELGFATLVRKEK